MNTMITTDPLYFRSRSVINLITNIEFTIHATDLPLMIGTQFEVHASALIPGECDAARCRDDEEVANFLNVERRIGVHDYRFAPDQLKLVETWCACNVFIFNK